MQKAGAQAIVGTFLTVATAVAEAEANLDNVTDEEILRQTSIATIPGRTKAGSCADGSVGVNFALHDRTMEKEGHDDDRQPGR